MRGGQIHAHILDDLLLGGPIPIEQVAREAEKARLNLGHVTRCTPGRVRAHAKFRAETGPYEYGERDGLIWLTRCDDPDA